jgi:hypothetical protein
MYMTDFFHFLLSPFFRLLSPSFTVCSLVVSPGRWLTTRLVIVVSLRHTVSKQLIDTLGATRGCFGCGYEVSLLLQSVDQILKCSSVHLHPLQQDAVFQLPLWSLVQLSDELQTLAMKRILCHMPVRHKQHAMRLMRHELRGPFDGRRIDDRLSMVFADGIDQRELSSLLVNSAP